MNHFKEGSDAERVMSVHLDKLMKVWFPGVL